MLVFEFERDTKKKVKKLACSFAYLLMINASQPPNPNGLTSLRIHNNITEHQHELNRPRSAKSSKITS
jgi:hypothetical protein